MTLRHSSCLAGLGSDSYTAVNAGEYKLGCKSTIAAPSAAIITISQSGSKSVSAASSAPSALQSHIENELVLQCAAGDVLTVAITSSNNTDIYNTKLQSVITLTQGN